MKISPLSSINNAKNLFLNQTDKKDLLLHTGNSKSYNATPSSALLKAYNNVSFGMSEESHEKISFNPDTNEIVLKLLNRNPDISYALLSYRTSKQDKEAKTLKITPENGIFTFKFPVLDKKTNAFVKSVLVDSISYAKADDSLAEEEVLSADGLKINPKDYILVKKQTINIDGNRDNTQHFTTISEGNVEGKFEVFDKYSDFKRIRSDKPIVAVLNDTNGLLMDIFEPDFSIPNCVKALLIGTDGDAESSFLSDCLGHAASRLRRRQVFAVIPNSVKNNLCGEFAGKEQLLKVEAEDTHLNVRKINSFTPVDTTPVTVPPTKFVDRVLTSQDKDFNEYTVGLKAYNLGKLKNMPGRKFKVPEFVVVPAGLIDKIKKDPINEGFYSSEVIDGKETQESYESLVKRADSLENPEMPLMGLRRFITQDIFIPDEIRDEIFNAVRENLDKDFGDGSLNKSIIARSSFNGEDSDACPTQGLYDSIPGIRTYEELFKGVKGVWASKWKDLAYTSRITHSIDHADVQPNVILQNIVPVDYTFTMYSANPKTSNKNKVLIQLAPGVDCGMAGKPYIFEYDKITKKVERLGLATKGRMKPINKIFMDDAAKTKYDVSDYSNDPFNRTNSEYSPILKQIGEVAEFIEKNMGNIPQDIEGGIKFNKENPLKEPEIHIWQTRDAKIK